MNRNLKGQKITHLQIVELDDRTLEKICGGERTQVTQLPTPVLTSDHNLVQQPPLNQES